jgi:hypothetical protein
MIGFQTVVREHLKMPLKIEVLDTCSASRSWWITS